MDIRDVKKSLNREVLHNGQKYLFAGCMLRRHRKTGQFYYEAELQDPRNEKWVVCCQLSDIQEVTT